MRLWSAYHELYCSGLFLRGPIRKTLLTRTRDHDKGAQRILQTTRPDTRPELERKTYRVKKEDDQLRIKRNVHFHLGYNVHSTQCEQRCWV